MQNKRSRDMTQGPIVRKIFDLSWPMIFGILAVMSITLVDTYFVGQLGTKPLAALSFTFPVTFTISSLAIGLSAGTASVVARAIGSKDEKKTKQLSTDGLALSFLIVLVLSVSGYMVIKPLFSLMGAEGEVLDMIVRYMRIWFFSMPFLVIPMVVNALIRAAGDAFWPSVIMIASAVLNVILTPAFIQGWSILPAMDIEGAAIATLIARCLVFILAGALIIFREKMLVFQKRSLQQIKHSWLEISKIAIPAAFGNALYPVTTGIVTAILAKYGDEAVAAYGAATRIEAFACIPMFAMSAAIGPICGQNWGAGKSARVNEAQMKSYIACVIWSSVIFALFLITAPWIAQQFTSDEMVANYIKQYLLIVSLTFWGYGICIIAAGCYNAIGKPLYAVCYYALRCFVLYVPFCWLVSVISSEVEHVFYAIAFANISSGIFIAYHALRLRRQHNS